MTDREKMFAYLDGAADGLREGNKTVVEVLQEIRNEIANIPLSQGDGEINWWYRSPEDVVKKIFDIIDDKIKEYSDERMG